MTKPTLLPQFLVITLVPHTENREITRANADEVASLIQTYGGEVKLNLTQNAIRLDGETYIGSGKANEISGLIVTHNIDVIVVNDNLSASQIYALQRLFDAVKQSIEVWDRTDLILQIFQKHATTAEAKLQIELANVKHEGPAARDLNAALSKQGYGVGARGKGETNTVIMQRMWREKMAGIQAELKKVSDTRLQQIEHRRRLGLSTISIVGYTNAGKSTLFNVLTKKGVKEANALFVTLDSSVGKMYLLPIAKEVFISDTIGFIQNLPPELINAFTSTLMETVNADVLLHVIDASDPQMTEKIQVVEAILEKILTKDQKIIYIFNKIDRIDPDKITELTEKYQKFDPQFISAKSLTGIPELINKFCEYFK